MGVSLTAGRFEGVFADDVCLGFEGEGSANGSVGDRGVVGGDDLLLADIFIGEVGGPEAAGNHNDADCDGEDRGGGEQLFHGGIVTPQGEG